MRTTVSKFNSGNQLFFTPGPTERARALALTMAEVKFRNNGIVCLLKTFSLVRAALAAPKDA